MDMSFGHFVMGELTEWGLFWVDSCAIHVLLHYEL